jgi:hypothetical protein
MNCEERETKKRKRVKRLGERPGRNRAKGRALLCGSLILSPRNCIFLGLKLSGIVVVSSSSSIALRSTNVNSEAKQNMR